MQGIVGMRQLRFDSNFWPDMHVEIQQRRATGVPLPNEFFEDLTQALATLATHDISMMRVDFVRFPIDVPNDPTRRCLHVGNNGSKLIWMLQGAAQDAHMRAIAGYHVVVLQFVF